MLDWLDDDSEWNLFAENDAESEPPDNGTICKVMSEMGKRSGEARRKKKYIKQQSKV